MTNSRSRAGVITDANESEITPPYRCKNSLKRFCKRFDAIRCGGYCAWIGCHISPSCIGIAVAEKWISILADMPLAKWARDLDGWLHSIASVIIQQPNNQHTDKTTMGSIGCKEVSIRINLIDDKQLRRSQICMHCQKKVKKMHCRQTINGRPPHSQPNRIYCRRR